MEYDTTDVAEDIDFSKTDDSQKCIIWHYICYIKHIIVIVYLLQTVMGFHDVAIVTLGENHYRTHFLSEHCWFKREWILLI